MRRSLICAKKTFHLRRKVVHVAYILVRINNSIVALVRILHKFKAWIVCILLVVNFIAVFYGYRSVVCTVSNKYATIGVFKA